MKYHGFKRYIKKMRTVYLADQDHAKAALDDLQGFMHDELKNCIVSMGKDPFNVIMRDDLLIKLCEIRWKQNKLNIALVVLSEASRESNFCITH